MDSDVRVRIAPSPTGDWHLGNARTALFSYLFARKHSGKFYLRVEDTDQTRLVPGSVERLQQILEWLNFKLDPYDNGSLILRQSDNLKRYQEVANQLVESGQAYYCFATSEELTQMREEQQALKKPPRYDNRWGYRELPLEEAKKRTEAGDLYVIRQKLQSEGTLTVKDLIHGDVTFDTALLDDHVLLKSDGFPTYHLAHVVDDHDTSISHVIRGGEWLPSTPRHIQLHQALGWDLPEYAHVPVILGPDKGKLSKRHGAKPVIEYQVDGYLPEALLNFLVLLGWSSGNDQEFFTREEMVKLFSFERVHPSPAVFDVERLNWFNANYIRNLSVETLRDRLLAYWDNHDVVWRARYTSNPTVFDAIVAELHDRLVTFKELAEHASFFYEDPEGYDPKLLILKGQTPDEVGFLLQAATESLSNLDDWSHDSLETVLRALAASKQTKAGSLLWPLRVALTGLPASSGVFEVLAIVGKEASLRRIAAAITLLKAYELTT